MIRVLFATLIFVAIGVPSSSGAVALTFNTGTDGFASTNGGTVTNNSGRLQILALGGSNFFENGSRAATLSFMPGTALGDEMALAYSNGGTISFDYSISGDDITWGLAGVPAAGTLLEMQLAVGSGLSSDTEVDLFAFPTIGATTSRTFSVDIVQGSGNQFDGTNGTIQFDNSPDRFFALGLKDQSDLIDNATIFIDNFTVSANASAVPEPSSVAFLAIGGAGLALRRRKSKTNAPQQNAGNILDQSS
ncbi:PEP-CTERM sorting domain-containing protein [Rhodopirellula baltica]|uniref:Ice-binding protein C-terminal domain-containing protein n=1 Tax=Rhodopirellula baltica (strain DSM 10527 / NCIMB 13988 / SH1) TaxID=243090 RepID=Q7UV63_RHOBA|nr:PEP-CTERM sorting domain-containing protein [Rhodopirellula baltica]CAD72863.1 hypothetical protein-transmembrane prediction [Rhodopirellula baltica SH 1]